MQPSCIASRISQSLDLHFPLILAPMGAGPTTAQQVIQACHSRVLGSIAGAYLSPQQLRSVIQEVRAATAHAFAVNLFIPTSRCHITSQQWEAMLKLTRVYREELQLNDPQLPKHFTEDFTQQFQAVLDLKPAVFSFTFGAPTQEMVEACHARQIRLLGTATSVAEAMHLAQLGVDWICAQGFEAGGHRGRFLTTEQDQQLKVFPLLKQIKERVDVPIIAAGGIMDGAAIAAAFAAGAEGVQMGTAFIACTESGISPAYKDALINPKEKQTRMTRAFSGRDARGLVNRFMQEMSVHEPILLPYPAQNALTRDIRQKAAKMGKAEFLSLWAGEGVNLLRPMKTSDLIALLMQETLQNLS